MKKPDKKIILQSGEVFYGYGFGADTETICDMTYNTSMVGYQEVLTNPSHTYQIVVMTYPLIGNYGITDEDYESKTPTLGGFVVRDYNDLPSNFRYTGTLAEIMEENRIPGISGVDTRMLTRIIRDRGACKGMIANIDTPTEVALQRIKEYSTPTDGVQKVGCKKVWYSRTPNHQYNVVAIDCGIKLSTIRRLNQKSCNVTVVPHTTTPEEILALKPDGVFVSNGPGDPNHVTPVIDTLKSIVGALPVFGICLGHQLLALSCGAKVKKMPHGHRGGNYAVKDVRTGKIDITSQAHEYAVDPDSLKGTGLTITHTNLKDGSIEGLEWKQKQIFSVQFHPESAPGPQDTVYLFDRFIDLIEEAKCQREQI